MQHKIMFVHGNNDIIGGQELSLLIRLKGLKTKRFQSLVIIPERGIFSELLEENAIEFKFVKLSRLSKKDPFLYLKTVFQLFRLIKQKRIALVNASGAYPAQYCLPAARMAGISCVAHINNTVYSAQDLKRSFISFLDGIVAVSGKVKEDILTKTRCEPNKIKIIYNPVSEATILPEVSDKELDTLRASFGIRKATRLIGQIGQLIPRKGLECFVQMAKKIKQEKKDVKFMIIGQAPPQGEEYAQQIRRLVQEYGLAKDFIFTGFQRDVFKFIALLDICVNCSSAEGGPRIVVEAMAMGKPVLTTKVGFTPEVIKNGFSGYLFSVNQSASMAETALRLLKDDVKRQMIGSNARKAIEKSFSVTCHNEKLTEFYCQLLNRKRGHFAGKARILYYDPSSGYGGAASALVHLLSALDRTRYFPFVAVLHNGLQFDKIRDLGIKLVKIKYKELPQAAKSSFLSYCSLICNLVLSIPLALFLTYFIRKKKIDLVHINTNIMLGIPAIVAAKLTGVACVCHIRETRQLVKRERLFTKWVDRFITLNSNAYKIYGQDISNKKLSVVYDGINLDGFKNISGTSFRKEFKLNGFPAIGVIARIVKGKGQKEFVLAAKDLLWHSPQVKFIIAGDAKGGDDSYYKEVKDLVANSNLSANIIFTGWRNDIKDIISALDILVLPSTTFPEGLPNAIIEAMAMAKPVVATNIPGPSDIIIDGKSGFLVAPGDIKALTGRIIYLLDNQDIARRMGVEARKRIEEVFDIKKQVKEIENIYENLLAKKS